MDAHLFRRLTNALGPLLTQARLEKIQSFSDDIFSFLFFTAKGKQQLCLRSGRQNAFLFLTAHRLSPGCPPSAEVMRLRKHLQCQRVRAVVALPFQRRLYLLFGSAAHKEGALSTLLLDLREGVSLEALSPDEIPLQESISWPDRDELLNACQNWQNWPVLTPKLRRVLSQLDEPERLALVSDLKTGEGDLFLYTRQDDGSFVSLLAWPLPRLQQEGLLETASSDVLALFERAGQHIIFEEITAREERLARENRAKQRKKLERLAKKLDEEHERLTSMCGQSEQAKLLQAHLWRLNPAQKCREVFLAAEHGLPELRLTLNERYSICENMQRLFHTAERGKRGLIHLAERREALQRELQGLEERRTCNESAEPKKRSRELPALPREVQAFYSSDGFLLLRGRSAKGNLTCRKLGKGHDIWLHAENGPGSHVVIRLDYPGQVVPERTLMEAGSLAACKSWQAHACAAQIQYAELRHIKSMRGAKEGTVRIDKILLTLTAPVDHSLEEKLQAQ